ncbi:hypothetical protein ACFQ14_09715 [Pseudahrensia aquimaris]|uniref:Inner membrane protein n=1 Tax=Pseudahrensia aquimaris TaxID=744461 RepID=A0ABW3FGU5_9HYPH
MFHVDLLGYLAGLFLLLMASMKNQTHMRMCNIAGNVCFVAYGFLAGVMPVLVLNIIIMGLHVYRMVQARTSSAKA